MSKIVILGLGYVGWEICCLYKYSQNEVVVVDNQFYPDRVIQINNWGQRFKQRDIFNIKDIIKDADILYNTVSVTLVPQTKEQSNPEIDSLIERIGTEGNRYVLENTNGKLVFLSTHVVFEGYNKIDIEEDCPPLPLLAYGKSKYQSELDIKNSGKDYIIGRLGSTYGYNPAIRWKIVGNLFSKMAAVDRKIKMFNGNCYKPVCGTVDVARALKFLAENYNKETFHLVSQNIKIKEIVGICKRYAPDLEVEEMSDNGGVGYGLSDKKILSTGFLFQQNIESEIAKMVAMWS